jgi:lipopolysaccharide heptosyltransferase II
VLASKSLRALRAGFPNADLHLLTSTDAASIAKNYEFLNHVWAFPIRELRSNKFYLFDILKLILSLRRIEFSSIINLYMVGSKSGALKMGCLFLFLKSKTKVGHGSKGFSLFLTKKLPADTFKNRHLVDAMMDIAILSGGLPDQRSIEVIWDEDCEEKWNDLFLKNISKKVIGINPGGDRKNRRWNPDCYAFVADRLIEKFDARIIIFGGPGEEEIARYIEHKMNKNAVNIAGKVSLNDLAYLISRLDLLVTNDSGPMHMAAATKTPVVAIFGPEDVALTGPYTSPNLYRVINKPVDCRPCNKVDCNRPVCLDLITPEEVFDTCVDLLSSTKLSPINE